MKITVSMPFDMDPLIIEDINPGMTLHEFILKLYLNHPIETKEIKSFCLGYKALRKTDLGSPLNTLFGYENCIIEGVANDPKTADCLLSHKIIQEHQFSLLQIKDGIKDTNPLDATLLAALPSFSPALLSLVAEYKGKEFILSSSTPQPRFVVIDAKYLLPSSRAYQNAFSNFVGRPRRVISAVFLKNEQFFAPVIDADGLARLCMLPLNGRQVRDPSLDVEFTDFELAKASCRRPYQEQVRNENASYQDIQEDLELPYISVVKNYEIMIYLDAQNRVVEIHLPEIVDISINLTAASWMRMISFPDFYLPKTSHREFILDVFAHHIDANFGETGFKITPLTIEPPAYRLARDYFLEAYKALKGNLWNAENNLDEILASTHASFLSESKNVFPKPVIAVKAILNLLGQDMRWFSEQTIASLKVALINDAQLRHQAGLCNKAMLLQQTKMLCKKERSLPAVVLGAILYYRTTDTDSLSFANQQANLLEGELLANKDISSLLLIFLTKGRVKSNFSFKIWHNASEDTKILRGCIAAAIVASENPPIELQAEASKFLQQIDASEKESMGLVAAQFT